MKQIQLQLLIDMSQSGRLEPYLSKEPDSQVLRLYTGIQKALSDDSKEKNGEESNIEFFSGLLKVDKILSEELNRRDIEPHEASGKVKIFTWKEFTNREFEEPRWIVENIIPEKGLVAIAGSPESFKSLFSEYLAIQVASGESLLDRFETNKTSVLIIDQENIPSWLHKRITQLSQEDDLPIHFYDKDETPFNLLEEEIYSEVLDYIGSNKIGLVVIDTLRLAHDKEENSSTELKPIIDKLKELASKTAVVFIHHHRKTDRYSRGKPTGEDMMGSILIRGAVDSQLTLTNLGEQADGITKIKVAQTKSRYTRPTKSFEMALEASSNTLTFVYKGEVEEEKLKKDEAKEAILILLGERDWKRQELIDQLAFDGICGSRTTEEALKELQDEERVTHTTTKPRVYSLVEEFEENIPQTANTNSNHGIAESEEEDGTANDWVGS